MKISYFYSRVGRSNVSTKSEAARLIDTLRASGAISENLYQELEMDSRYVDVHEDVSCAGDRVQLHSHTFYELLYCEEGSVQYLLGAERYRFQKGDIIVIPPGVSHRPVFPPDMAEPYHRIVLWVNPDFANELIRVWLCPGQVTDTHTILRTAGTRWEYIADFFRHLLREAKQQSIGWEACVYGSSIALWVNLFRGFRELQSLSPIPEQKELLDEITAYVETHLAEKLTLSGTARHFLVSESTVSQTFRQKLNVSFYRFVTQRRLIAAKALIADGVSLDSIPEQIGFSEYSTFYRAFKQEYGLSPMQFRRLLPSPEAD